MRGVLAWSRNKMFIPLIDLVPLVGFSTFALCGLTVWGRNLPANWTLEEQTKYNSMGACGFCC